MTLLDVVQTGEEQIGDLRERLAARDVVERAKRKLQSDRGVGEADAFVILRRGAMDARITLAEAAAAYLGETAAVEPSAGEIGRAHV